MTVVNWTEGEVFTARIYKRLTSRPDVLWANTYELFALSSNVTGDIGARDALTMLAGWESRFHLGDVEFDRGIFSTHVEDGTPYNPASFVALGYTSLVGSRPVGTEEAQPLQTCLFARRQVNAGRNGRALYRRVLTEDDVVSPGGTPSLVPTRQVALQALMDGPWDGSAEGNDIHEALLTLGLDLVMVGNTPLGPLNIRTVTAMVAAGVTIKKYNNAFYNRRTPPAPTP